MGEIADMMLDGTLCSRCGAWAVEKGDVIPGHPQLCSDCKETE